MSITLFGAIVLLVGTILLFAGGMAAMLAFVMITTLFGGSAAIALGATGSSIPPANLALVFMVLRVILPGPGQMASLGRAIRDNIFLIVFASYGAVTAWILPRLFAGATKVTPLHPGQVRTLFEAAPVTFSTQNITTSIYLLGTLAAGIGGYIGAARPGGAALLVRIGIVIAILHAMLGFMSVVFDGTALDVIVEFFRNGHYAQLDQSIEGVSRMSGIWPEASGFAAYGGAWFIFMAELWLRDVRPRWTGFAAALLGVALLASTSSTAYVTLAGYSGIMTMRTLLIPGSVKLPKALTIGAGILFMAIVALAAFAFIPTLIGKFTHVIEIMTIDKTQSFSGRQRAFWAAQGLDAFVASNGLGIGAGSFRSSSLLTAILGSMGVIGAIAFAGHLMRAFKPLRPSTYFGSEGDSRAVGSAASWTALLMLMPAAVASPSPDPGLAWALFCGFALALRRSAAPRPANEGHAGRMPPIDAGVRA